MSELSSSQGRDLQAQHSHAPPDGISESDYETIEDAVMETARGRWFLKEYARRMRAAETASLRGALERIERIVSQTHAPLAEAATQQRVQDGMARVAERLTDIAWYMRERGFSASVCASIDEEARQLTGLAEMLASPSSQGSSTAEPVAEPVRASAVHGDGVVIDGKLAPIQTFEEACAGANLPDPRSASGDGAAAQVDAFPSLARLSTRERLALFA